MSALTGKQSQLLHVLLGKLGVTDRAVKLRLVSAILYRPVESTRDLTFDEASVVINTLKGLTETGEPSAAIDALVETAEGRATA